MLFVTIASSRAEVLPFVRWCGLEINVPNLGFAEQFTAVLIEMIIWDAVLIWLNGGASSKVDCVVQES